MNRFIITSKTDVDNPIKVYYHKHIKNKNEDGDSKNLSNAIASQGQCKPDASSRFRISLPSCKLNGTKPSR